MQSELYRRKLYALLTFAKVHEMELQAHFAPIGLMFNKGTLSDWEAHQDETIWEAHQDAGKDIFYKVNYSKEGLSAEEKMQEDKDYVEGEGWSKLIKTSISHTPKIKEWIDKAKEELKIEKRWYTDITDWYNGDKTYSGSGSGYGARQSFAKAIGFDDCEVNSLFEAGIYSMLQSGEVNITNESKLSKKLTEDSALKEREKTIAKEILNDPRYLKESFKYVYDGEKGLQFGGKRGQGKLWEQFKNPFTTKYKDTWKVAANELTQFIRSASVSSRAEIFKEGNVVIFHTFEDQFDLRPSLQGERGMEYDVVSIISGFLYHDIAGGNDLMKVKANWNNFYNKSQINWMANVDKIIEDGMSKMKEKMEQDRLKWIRETR